MKKVLNKVHVSSAVVPFEASYDLGNVSYIQSGGRHVFMSILSLLLKQHQAEP